MESHTETNDRITPSNSIGGPNVEAKVDDRHEDIPITNLNVKNCSKESMTATKTKSFKRPIQVRDERDAKNKGKQIQDSTEGDEEEEKADDRREDIRLKNSRAKELINAKKTKFFKQPIQVRDDAERKKKGKLIYDGSPGIISTELDTAYPDCPATLLYHKRLSPKDFNSNVNLLYLDVSIFNKHRLVDFLTEAEMERVRTTTRIEVTALDPIGKCTYLLYLSHKKSHFTVNGSWHEDAFRSDLVTDALVQI